MTTFQRLGARENGRRPSIDQRSSADGRKKQIVPTRASTSWAPRRPRWFVARLATVLFATSLVGWATSVSASGFAVPEQDHQATAMGGSRVARVHDASAVYYNPGGLAFAKGQVLVGATALVLGESLYQGQGPGVGEGTTGEQVTGVDLLAHAYLSRPLSKSLVAGLGIYSPFWMSTEWDNPSGFSGRYLATESDLRTYDFHPTIAYRISDTFGVGVGVIYRLTDLAVGRRIPGENPFTGQTQDIGDWQAESDFEGAFGWSLGVQQHFENFSWGVSYRSAIDVDYAGVGTLTQISTGNEQLDALNASVFPYGRDLAISSNIDFPDQLTLGAAIGFGNATLELDVSRTGWSSFDRWVVDSPTFTDLSRTYLQQFDDTMAFRLGFELARPNGAALHAGFAVDESPQPSSTVGPLFVDADRTILSAGYSRDWLRVALQWTDFAERQVGDNVDDFNGSYRNSAWMLGVSVVQ